MFTELHDAAGRGDTDRVIELLDNGAAIDATTSEGYTPLMCALMRYVLIQPQNETALKLIERGANVNARTNSGFTPLMAAVSLARGSVGRQAELDIVRVLLEHGADVDATDRDGASVLSIASRSQKHELIKVLMEHNGNVT